jgi:hypothetical protein
MAQTYGNLWPRFVSWENLLAAYHLCRRRKRVRPEAARFQFDWEFELIQLQRELSDGSYVPGEYRNFFIHEPKRRKISAAPYRDRIVHHAVVRVLEPIFERRFVFDSYACRRHKGTHRAVDRAHRFLRSHAYYLKTDIVRFFPNVDHAVLLDVIGRRVRDRRLMDLIRRIIASGAGLLADEATDELFPGDDLFALLRPRGLPIGNLTSQFFANVLLDVVDHCVKEELRAPGYVRYADDLVLFGGSKSQLWEWREAVARRLAGLRLKLHTDKTCIARCRRGLKFLGFVLRPGGRRLPRQSLLRFRRRMRRLRWLKQNGMARPRTVSASVAGWLAYARDANSEGVRRTFWRQLRF